MGMKRRPGEIGRLWFEGNPWPDGHQLSELVWSARIDGGALWFDLHARTVDYSREYPASMDDDSEAESSWTSVIVWLNYHATILSSTHWGVGGGIRATTAGDPIALATLGKRRFRVDPLPEANDTDDDDMGFHIYCLGHDAVADHTIRFTPRSDGRFDLRWTGMHANAYVGDMDYVHPFVLRGVLAPPAVTIHDAGARVSDYIADAADWSLSVRRR